MCAVRQGNINTSAYFTRRFIVVQNGGSDDPTLIEITAEPTTTAPVVVFTVPNGKRVVITDIVITAGAGTGTVAIQRNGVNIVQANMVSPERRYQQTYRSGIEFNQGDTVGVARFNGAFYELRGFQTDLE